MKTAVNIFLFLVIIAFTTSVAGTFAARINVEALSQQADADDETDTDPDDTSNRSNSNNAEEEEEEQVRVKELFCEGIAPFVLEATTLPGMIHFGEVPDFCEFHLTNPPYSPPELL